MSQKRANFVYELPEPSRVRIRITHKTRRALIYRTLMDWQDTPAGTFTVEWDGLDSSGNPINPRNTSVIMETEPSADKITDPSQIQTPSGHFHALHDPNRCKELGVTIDSPSKDSKLSGAVRLKAHMDLNRRGYGDIEGHGIRIYIDGELLYENEEEKGSDFEYEIDTTQIGNGAHMLSINVCDHKGHSGTDSIPIHIENLPAPIGQDLSGNVALACCGRTWYPPDITPDTDEDETGDEPDQTKDCGKSSINIATGNLMQDHATPFIPSSLPLGISAVYNSRVGLTEIPLKVRILDPNFATATITWAIDIAGKRYSGNAVYKGNYTDPMTGQQSRLFEGIALWDTRDSNGNLAPEGSYTYTTSSTVSYWGGPSYSRSTSEIVEVKRPYNGPLGINWFFNYGQRLVQNTDGTITFVDAAGSYKAFTREPNGAYITPAGSDYTLTKRTDNAFNLRHKNGIQMDFDSYGKLTALRDRSGNFQQVSYSGSDLDRVTDSYGRYLQFSYSGGNIYSVTDSLGRQTSYSYDSYGHLTAITDSEGGIERFTYDTFYRITSKTCPRGTTTTYEYSDSRITKVTDPVGNITTYAYDTDNRKTTVRDPNAGITIYIFNRYGEVLEKTDPLGRKTKYLWNTKRKLTRITDHNNRSAYFTYDAKGNLSIITDALGNQTYTTYEAVYNQPITYKDQEGNVTTYTYDAKGNLTAIRDPEGNITRMEYDAKGLLIKITTPQGAATDIAYDAYGYPAAITDPNGNKTTLSYNASGNLLVETDALNRTTNYTYDRMNRLKTATDPEGATTQYAYDPSGNLIKLTDPNSNITAYNYAGCGMLVEETDPLGYSASYRYDGNKNLVQKTDANGKTTAYAYDFANQLKAITYPDGTNTSFNYDNTGNITFAQSSIARLQQTFDALNRLTKSDYLNLYKTVNYQYDRKGRRTRLTAPNGTYLTYTYSRRDLLTNIYRSDGKYTTFSYDTDGKRLQRLLPNNIKAAYTYDPASRLLSLIHTTPTGQRINAVNYQMDAVGNRIQEQENGQTTNYAYDLLNRLKQVSGNTSDSYAYDPAGNRLSDIKYQYTYDQSNRLIKRQGEQLSYAKGAIPIAIQKGTYTGGQEILLKQGPPQSGNFGCLALGGRGADTYRDNLKYGYNATVKAGDLVDTEPGNMAGPTKEATQYRISAGKTKVIAPVVTTWEVSGRKQVRIESFAALEIIGMEGDAIRVRVVGAAEETRYTYDNNGNLIAMEDNKGKTTLEYDYGNRLVKLTKPDGTWTKFTYDPFGRRYSKETSDGQKEIYLYDGAHILEVYDGSSMQLKSGFVHSDIIDEVLYADIQGKDVYYHQDGLNSVKALTDAGGNIITNYDYDAWGNPFTMASLVANPFTYTGREYDKETGALLLSCQIL